REGTSRPRTRPGPGARPEARGGRRSPRSRWRRARRSSGCLLGCDPAGVELAQLSRDPVAERLQLPDPRVQLGQLAVVGVDAAGAGPPGLDAGVQAGHEGADLLQVEPVPQQRADLANEPQVGLVVVAVAVRPATGHHEALLLVVADRAGAGPRPPGELPDAHLAS